MSASERKHVPPSMPGLAVEEVVLALAHAPTGDPRARLDVLSALGEWLGADDGLWRLGLLADPEARAQHRSLRVDALTAFLREQQTVARTLGDLVGALLLDLRAANFLARAGTASETRLLSEIGNRIARKVLPAVDDGVDLGGVVDALFIEHATLTASTNSLLGLWSVLVEQSTSLRDGLARAEDEVVEGAAIVGASLLQLAVDDDVRVRLPTRRLAQSPFATLARATDALLRSTAENRSACLADVDAAIAPARGEIVAVREGLETGSISADLVFRIDVVERLLARLALLVQMLDARPGRGPRVLTALRTLADERTSDTTLRGLVKESSRLLARRVVETAGRSGEHYIASTPTEYRHMWLSAAGGGALMAFVAPMKFLLAWLKLPLFFAGLAAGLNYAVAFVLMQVFGLTLATKQPSMTAAALAAAVQTELDDGRRRQLVSLIARTTRSQLAAIVGNLGVLVPVSVGVHFGVVALLGRPFLDVAYAGRVLADHHLFASGSIVYAALTGVWLWVSSMAGGWFDNWLRHRRVPDGVRSSRRIRRVLGTQRSEKLAALIDHAAGPFVGNVVIGLLLGLTPAFAGFFGLPVDVRHITISTASVTLAALTLGPVGLHLQAILWAVSGLAAVAAMNFAVSFALAMSVALRALDVDATVTRTLLREVFVELRQRPGSFLVPGKD